MRTLYPLTILFTLFGKLYGQSISHVEITGPSTATFGTQTLFNVAFWSGGVQVDPPAGEFYYWDYSGVSTVVQETPTSLRVVYGTPGTHNVYYEYSTFDNFYSDYHTIQVSGDPCSGVVPSAPDVSRIGAGSVTLSATSAPSGFTYQWYAANGTTLLSSSQNFTTPSISTTTTYQLANRHTSSGCITAKVSVRAIVSDHNYVKKYTPRRGTSNETTVKTGTPSQSYKDFAYFDGLGRPAQTIRKQGSASGWDIVTPIVYDAVGRQAREYLPYARNYGAASGGYQKDAIAHQSGYYHTHYSDPYGYFEKQFEPSPLNRVEKQAAPGTSWKLGSGKEIKYVERPNTSNEDVRIWTVNGNGVPVSGAAFGAGALWATATTDADGQKTIAYVDKQGRMVLRKQQIWPTPSEGHQGWFCTYYVYDDFGDLRVVIPPLAVEKLVTNGWSFSTNTVMAEGLYFMYKYDGRRRLVEKRVPGKDWEFLVYDKNDRLVATQDGNLEEAGRWRYTKYDALDRPVMTGITEHTGKRGEVQAEVDNMGNNHAVINANTSRVRTGSTISSNKYDGFDEYVAGNSVTLRPGFSFKASGKKSFSARIGQTAIAASGAFPADEGEILTVMYYDNYGNVKAGIYSPHVGYGSATKRTSGLLTGKKVKNLASGVFYESAYFYDEKGQVIQTLSDHQLGGTVRVSTKYNFEGKPVETLSQFTYPNQPDIKRTFAYNLAGQLERVIHAIGGVANTLATYSYNELGEQTGKSHPEAGATLSFDYNIRGWLKKINETGSGDPLFGMELYYQSGASNNRFNGNISRQVWKGRDNVARRYDYTYDLANRLKWANFTPGSSEIYNYTVGEIFYDGNGNILAMHRRNQRTPSSYGYVDFLEYEYKNGYSNTLKQVRDGFLSTTYTADDFIERSTTAYGYDRNGNQTSNLDKQISGISYNHLNLPEKVTFTGSVGKITYEYDAEGNKLRQKVYTNGTLSSTVDYIGDFVFRDGRLDYLLHEEGRAVYESGIFQYEYHIKDHLGNVRQVVRAPQTTGFMATMEISAAQEEELLFEQLPESRQSGMEHNVTPGGDRVAWLNASRGRVLGPARTQEVQRGDSIRLSVYGKYKDLQKGKANIGSFIATGAKARLLSDLLEFGRATARSAEPNAITVFNIIDLLVKDLQKKGAPEAYMMYALYNSDSVLYKTGKQVLTKNAANRHEELKEELYISEDGYMEAFLVNETEEDVWFDDFSIQSTSPFIVQETHYDPWGLELTGLGFQAGGVKVNGYLYNGKELVPDLNLNLYDYGARFYDPVIGRWTRPDPMADMYQAFSPYNYTLNNPVRLIDPNGMWVEEADRYSTNDPNEIRDFISQQQGKGDKGKTYDGGTLDEVTVTASRINDGWNFGSNYSLGDFGTGLSLAGEGMWLLGENRSTSLYQQGFRRGLSGNYQLSGRNLSLFGNQPMTSATRPISKLAPLGKTLSGGGTALSVVSLGFDVVDYSSVDLSGSRLGYRAAGTGASIGAAYGLGGPYGAAVGGLFFMGEKAWDMTQPMRNEISRQYWQFDNALRRGWRPR